MTTLLMKLGKIAVMLNNFLIRGLIMWEIKHFKNYDAVLNFINKNEHKYQMDIIYINDGYAVEYKKLRVVY